MLRFATVGTSAIADRFVDAVSQLDCCELYACYSRSHENAEAYANKCGAKAAYSSFDELLEDPLVDALYIASPNGVHAAQATQAISAGKHVLVEKSFASNAAEATKVFKLAKQNNVLAMEAMRNIHGPGYEAVKQALSRVGRVRLAQLGFSKVTSRFAKLLAGEKLNLFDPMLSGGATMDIGIYVVELAIALFGAPNSHVSSAVTQNVSWAQANDAYTTIDLAASAVLSYPDGLVTLSWGKVSDDYSWSQVQGDAATLMWDESSYPRHAKLMVHQDMGMVYARTEHEGETLSIDVCDNDMVYEIQDFVEATQEGCSSLKSAFYESVTLESLKLMDAIRKEAGVIFPADNACKYI